MDMRINGNWLAERSINRLQLSLTCWRHGCAPETLGTGMHQRKRTMNLNAWQAAQPGEPLFSQHSAGCHRHLFENDQERSQLRCLSRKLLQRFGRRKHFIGIADHALPAEIANA